jgi:hypothetical protein
MYDIDSPEGGPACRHRKSPSWQRCSITGSYELGTPRDEVLVARCTKGISSRSRRPEGRRRGVDESYIYGTNFRHAVEFSRSGRTPSRLSRAGQGQPELRYLVGSAGSNPAPPSFPLGLHPPRLAFLSLPWRGLTWGNVGRLRDVPGSVRRTGRRLVSATRRRQIAPQRAASPAKRGL